MPVPNAKVEIRFDGATWEDVSSYVDPQAGISIQRGRENETDDPMSVGTCSLVLRNDDGRFSPGLSSSPHYPYVVQGVAVKVSAYAGGAWRVRFYGTVQNWSVQWLNPLGTEAITTVTCNDSFGAFPQYELWQASEQAVRGATTPPTHYWPRLDVDGAASSKFSDCDLVDNGVSADAGTMKLPLDEGEPHPLFTCSSGKRKLTATIPQMFDGYHWRVSIVIDKPSASGNILELTDTFGAHYLAWNGTDLTYYAGGFSVTPPSTSSSFWPAVASVRVWDSGGFEYTELRLIGSSGANYSDSGSVSGYGLKKVVVCPTLSGGATFSAGHLIVDYNETTSWAPVLLAPRIPASVTAAAQLSAWAGGPTISGGTVGAAVIPQIEARDAGDALGALITGIGARLADNLDGTLQQVDFPPSGTVIALPSGEIDPSVTWETSDVGWASDATVTWPDGTSYTATRPDGKRQSVAIEGVHATRSKDRSYADWLVWNTASTGSPRLQQAPYDLGTMTDADAVTICSVNVGTRVSLTGLPSQMPTSLLLIVEGIEETITDAQWLVTFKTSPDVYSRLFILDDPVQGVLDAGYLLAP